jgi:hypothetical protein
MLIDQLTEEAKKALKDKYPGVTLDVIKNELVAPGVAFILKRPDDAAWKRYRGMQGNEEQAPFANRTLVFGQLVDPAPAEFTAMLVDRPGLVETLAVKIREAAGASNASTLEKL